MIKNKAYKIWQVTVGDNWSSMTIIARNYNEAGRKVLRKIEYYTPRHQRFITSVVLIVTAEN